MRRGKGFVLLGLARAVTLAAMALVFVAPDAAPAPAGDPFASMNVDRPAKEVQAPGFRLQTFAGEPLALEGLRGKVVAFYFWRTW